MFYEPKNGHGMNHDPFNALVTPRPIGWISTRGTDGSENLAPYSFFNAVAYTPPQVMFSSVGAKPDQIGTKDSVANIRETGVFCANVVESEARDTMNITSGPWPKTQDEFELAQLERAECQTIPCSRVANAPANLECQVTQIVPLKGNNNFLIIGEVTGIHMRDDCIKDGQFDVLSFKPLARLGYRDYAIVDNVFSLKRPNE